MKTSTKLLGGVALSAVVLMGGGALHVHNNVIPERIAAEMNEIMIDSFDSARDHGVTFTPYGEVEVKATGFFTYQAMTPLAEMSTVIPAANPGSTDDDAKVESTLPMVRLNVSFDDNMEAVNFALGRDDRLAVNLDLDEPVTVDLSAKPVSPDERLEDSRVDAQVTIAKYGARVILNGDAYGVTQFATGDIEGDLNDAGAVIDMATEFAAQSTVIYDGQGTYSDVSNDFGLFDFKLTVDADPFTAVPSGELSADKVILRSEMTDVPAQLEGLDLSELFSTQVLPESFAHTVEVENLSLSSAQVSQPASGGADFLYEVKGQRLHSDSAGFEAGFYYDLTDLGIENPAFQDIGRIEGSVYGVPVKTVMETVSDFLENDDSDIDPIFDLLNVQADILKALEDAGASVFVSADTASARDPENHSVMAIFTHSAKDGGLPGSGSILIQGFDGVAGALVENLGPEAGFALLMMLQNGTISDDGKDMALTYKLDAEGNITFGSQESRDVPEVITPDRPAP